jgi:hypothetical protein
VQRRVDRWGFRKVSGASVGKSGGGLAYERFALRLDQEHSEPSNRHDRLPAFATPSFRRRRSPAPLVEPGNPGLEEFARHLLQACGGKIRFGHEVNRTRTRMDCTRLDAHRAGLRVRGASEASALSAQTKWPQTRRCERGIRGVCQIHAVARRQRLLSG